MYFRILVTVGALVVAGVSSKEWHTAHQTLQVSELASPTTAEYEFNFDYGIAPEPTTAPDVPLAELVRRQAGVTTVCGLLSTNTSWSYTCRNNRVCGYNTVDRSNFGCCSAYSGNVVSGCFFPTTCYDSSVAATMTCGLNDSTCTWSSLYCASSAYPYCGVFVQSGLTAYNCFPSPSSTYQLVPVSGAASSVSSVSAVSTVSRTNTTASATRNSVTASSLGSGSSSSSSANTERVSFTNQQQTVSASSSILQSPTTRTSSALGADLGKAGENVYGLLMSFVLLIL